MNNFVISSFFSLALCLAGSVHAQSYWESDASLRAKDYATALKGFASLAEQGHAMAQEQLGRMYKFGQGTPKDAQQALAWFRKAAEQGSAVAQAEVGWAYWEGRGVVADELQALMWFNKSAEQGNSAAQYGLGIAYDKGRGVPKDEQQAIAWYEKAARQGHEKSKARLWDISAGAQKTATGEKPAALPDRTVVAKDDPKAKASIAGTSTSKEVQENPAYDKIEVGTVLKNGIGIAAFFKPIPLPEGTWVVASKRTEETTLTPTNGSGLTRGLPVVYLTLKNLQEKDPLLFAIVMTFTPYASNVNWGNRKCESTNPKLLADDFGSSENSMLYLCAYISSQSGFRNTVAKSSSNSNTSSSKSLAGLAVYPNGIADNALIVDLIGNQFRGRSIAFSFIFKREGDLFSDEYYARLVRDWAHAAGLTLAKVLGNNAATFVLPTPYTPQSAQ